METLKIILILSALILSSCSHKTIVKNCSPTVAGDYFVCDSVVWK